MAGTRAISTTSRRELSSSFFFLQGKAPKEIHAIVTDTLAYFLPGRAKDLSAYLYSVQNTVFSYVLLTVHLSVIVVINQLDAQNLVFIVSLLYASTCFGHCVLIIRRSKLYYTASDIVTLCRWPSGAQVESPLSTCAPDGHLQV